MNLSKLYRKALASDFLTQDEGIALYLQSPLDELIWVADQIRKQLHPENNVGWIIDRNVNITNVCIARCRFCNFHCVPKSDRSYITTLKEYCEKIDYLFQQGGDQLLLQGGLHPDLDLKFYRELFLALKQEYPALKLHALGPPEIHHLARQANKTYQDTLKILMDSGLDSLPGAGAEILVDRVRKLVSPGKCSAEEWLNVMQEAHKLNLLTSATMMFGHMETPEERIEHLIRLRDVQSKKPSSAKGFVSFIPWPFQDKNTILNNKYGVTNVVTSHDYIRIIATSRILLPNIPNIQASWLTVGKETGQVCLHAGANDFGSIMIEENVVSSAGAHHSFNAESIQQAIREAGFVPYQRNQKFEPIH